jgi:D-sedoheptulose 7-phosphate isomerase
MDKDTLERLRARASQHFLDSIAVKQAAEKILPEQVARGIVAMTDCLRAGGKMMADYRYIHSDRCRQ